MAEDRWPIQLANIIRAVRDTELAMAHIQERYAWPVRFWAGLPGGVKDKSRDAPGPAHHARHGCSVVPLRRETPLTEGDPNPVVPQSLRTVLNENDSQVQGDTP